MPKVSIYCYTASGRGTFVQNAVRFLDVLSFPAHRGLDADAFCTSRRWRQTALPPHGWRGVFRGCIAAKDVCQNAVSYLFHAEVKLAGDVDTVICLHAIGVEPQTAVGYSTNQPVIHEHMHWRFDKVSAAWQR